MNYIFTVCSNNYLAQASVLGRSIRKHEAGSKYIVFLCDEKDSRVDYDTIADEVIEVAKIEPDFSELVLKYNIIELNTAIKPRAVEYLFETLKAEKVIYLDPDIKIFTSLTMLYSDLDKYSILLTPHIYTPVPIDGKKPGENTFLNYGIYNLGFLALKNDSTAREFAHWWKNRTYKEGYSKPAIGLFVDQLPINHVPIFFQGVRVLENRGLNMAPWNLHERTLSERDGKYLVNGKEDLIFFHFSSFGVDSGELPLIHYDRYRMIDRPDLKNLYAGYNEEIKANNHEHYSKIESVYSKERAIYLNKLKRKNSKLARLLRTMFSS